MQLNEVKQWFRSYMDGTVAESMRQKGLSYRVIWGISIIHLQEMAKEIGQDEALARQLWKEDCRECKILATLVMPHDSMTIDETRQWVATLSTKETAQWLAFNLVRHLPFAKEWAEEAQNSNNTLEICCAQNVLAKKM